MSVSNSLIEYMKIHLISLEQDSEQVQKELDDMEDMECDEYRQLEIEDIYLNGQISATRHIINYALELERNNNAN